MTSLATKSEEETKKTAIELVNRFKDQLGKKCLVFGLEGDLGTGKTIFAKGVAEALGIKKVIRSPSFIIQREFPYEIEGVKGKFYHVDLWRMESEEEAAKLKIEELTRPGNVILIEWAEKMGEREIIFKKKGIILIKIKINFVDETTRNLQLSGNFQL